MAKPAFTLSASARAEIADALGPSASSTLPLVQALAAMHHAGVTTSPPRQRLPIAEARSLNKALAATISRIENASPELRGWLSGRTLFDIGTMSLWDEIVLATRELQKVEKRVSGRLESSSRFSRRGRPADRQRMSLAHDLATMLRLLGFKVGAARRGVFARVLEALLMDLYGQSPIDMFPLAKLGSETVGDMTPNELRTVMRKALKYLSKPEVELWSKLLSVH